MEEKDQAEPVKTGQSHSISIEAAPETCYKAICDFEAYPEWLKMCKKARVIERYHDGRARIVEFVIDAVYRDFRYVLEYFYDDVNCVLSWKYVEGDVRDVIGNYNFTGQGENKTHAEYTLHVDSGVPIPRRFANFLGKVEMRRSMKNLKSRVESL